MKFLTALLYILFPVAVFCQQSPVQWSISTEKTTESFGNAIHITGTIAKGWHVYAEKNAELGIEPLSIEWDNESVLRAGDIQSNIIRLNFKDPVFKTNLKILTGDAIDFYQPIKFNGATPASLTITVKGFASNNETFLPIEETKTIWFGESSAAQNIKLTTIDVSKPYNSCGESHKENNKSLFGIFILGFIGGLIALLTPCVFPMIPVTVSFFTNRAKTKQHGIKNGFLYGSFIFLIYLLASIPFHLMNNIQPEIFNNISTSAWLNVFFFAVFVFFSLSLFGLFELRLPSFAANYAGSKGGIFFMALTLAIVSFSCTGAILGSLLVGSLSSNGGAWQLTAGMGGFGAALALPFGLFAMFPQWLKRLPQSGSWLETIKKILAFIELALAFKFLSNADLVEHWGLLKREVFIGIWIIISVALAIYLLNLKWFFRFGRWNASEIRTGSGILTFLFAIYLTLGLSPNGNDNLKFLSGFPPPVSYSIFKIPKQKAVEADVVNDYEKALELAKQDHKPILIDFTGWACVNCRKMEENVWIRPEIKQLIKDQYILLSLYVDDRKKLPSAQQMIYKTNEGSEKEIKTVGEKWATFQAENFKQVTQPLYAIISPDEKLMNNPVGYTPDENKYRQWLLCGLDAFKNVQAVAVNK